jgi:hypothetical protein
MDDKNVFLFRLSISPFSHWSLLKLMPLTALAVSRLLRVVVYE